ncbi:MAG: hypothetical protein COB93_00925 [Sneathiella sp.]|nr:MAG: hypothetical protein COB93_00925 [Sneathiella sp.]
MRYRITPFGNLPNGINPEFFCKSWLAHVVLLVLICKGQGVYKSRGYSDRHISLCERAYQTLLNLDPKDFGPVFTYKRRGIKSVKTSFKNARRKAGLNDVRFHDLRHTFASRLVQGGVPLYDVMHMTGHKSLEMVQRYAHLAPEFQSQSIKVLDQLGHNTGTVGKPQLRLV